MNKKGQSFEDGIFAVVMILALAIGGLIATYMYDQVFVQFNQTDAFTNISGDTSGYAIAAFDAGNTVNKSWDYLILVVLIGFALSVLVLGFFVDVNTIFFPLFLIGIIIGLVFAVVMDYVWNEIVIKAPLNAYVDRMPITEHILGNITIYYIVIAALSMVALFAKTRSQQV